MSFQTLNRDGWTMQCPFCNEDISYTLINNKQLPVPFFYAEDSNDVLLRKADLKLVDEAFAGSTGGKPSLEPLKNLWLQILDAAPSTANGGRYKFWSNVKCPNCSAEIPYNDGTKDVEQRIFEPRIVLVNGASLIGDAEGDSWRINVLQQASS